MKISQAKYDNRIKEAVRDEATRTFFISNGYFELHMPDVDARLAQEIKQQFGVPRHAVLDESSNVYTWPCMADRAFGDDGLLAPLFPNYQTRLGQLQMARMEEMAILTGRDLIVCAPTGTGKGLAYTIMHAIYEQVTIISTSNKALMAQLAIKDGPLAQKALKSITGFSIGVLMGKGNYLCSKKASFAMGLSPDLAAWVDTTETGNLNDITFSVTQDELADIRIDDTCIGQSKCDFAHSCFYFRNKRNVFDSQIIITNHALTAIAALKPRALPNEISRIVVDECHSLAGYIESQLAETWSFPKLRRLIMPLEKSGVFTDDLLKVAIHYHKKIATWIEANGNEFVINSDQKITWLNKIADALIKITDLIDNPALKRRTENMVSSIIRISMPDDEYVRTVELDDEIPTFFMRPVAIDHIDIGWKPEDIEDAESFRHVPVTYTSATVDPDTFAAKHGIKNALTFVAPSPFDYKNQAMTFVAPSYAPPPSDKARHGAYVTKAMIELCEASNGGALLLFTSNEAMVDTAQALRNHFGDKYLILAQGEGIEKPELLNAFKSDSNAILFASKGFFEGVDVQGHALRLVALDKMPFEPETLFSNAMANTMPPFHYFNSETLPKAITDVQQVFGRLIRSLDCAGCFALLDSRYHSKRWGARVKKSLPEMTWTSDMGEVQDFYSELVEELSVL